MSKNSGKPNLNAAQADIIIPVIGLSGAGKSTFINAAAGEIVASINHDMFSCTKEIKAFTVFHSHPNNRRVILVEMPGFDDTVGGNAEPLRCIKEWLENTYRQKKTIFGIIYLWDNSQNRLKTGLHLIFDIFCTPKPFRHVVVATTKENNPRTEAEKHRREELERYLKASEELPQFIENDKDLAWTIINHIIAQEPFERAQLRELLQRLTPYYSAKFFDRIKQRLRSGRG